jgi:hypothetical protein
MKKLTLGFLALATALAITPVASADTIENFDFSFSSNGGQIITGSGILAVDVTAGPNYGVVMGISGFINDIPADNVSGPIEGLATSPGSGFVFDGDIFNYTNKLTLPPSPVGINTGLYFTFDGNGDTNDAVVLSNTHVSVLLPGGGSTVTADTDPDSDNVDQRGFTPPGHFNLVPSPEPSSLVLLGIGLFGLAFVAFRKAKPASLTLNS